MLSQLTLTGRYKLRVDVQARNGSWYYAEYSVFVVLSEVHNYRLQVSGYSGNAGDELSHNSGSEFTTYDRDNDPWTDSHYNNNCAVHRGSGCWYSSYCSFCDLNHKVRLMLSTDLSDLLILQSTRMWLTC